MCVTIWEKCWSLSIVYWSGKLGTIDLTYVSKVRKTFFQGFVPRIRHEPARRSVKKGCCHNKVSLFLRMDYFSFIFFPRMLILPNLISEYLMLYKAQWYFGSKLCARICIVGRKWLQWVSNQTRGKFLLEPINHFKQIIGKHTIISVAMYDYAESE